MLPIEISSMSKVKAKVDLYNGSTFVQTCTCSDVLERFSLNREGDTGKFFGFGICHKATIDFIDLFRTMPPITTDIHAVIQLGDGTNFDTPFPKLYITEINRNEKTNNITCTAYDRLYKASGHTFEELALTAPYSVRGVAEACADLLGLTLKIENIDDGSFDTYYKEGANIEPADNIRYILNAISEVTQTIYYINHNEELIFKRLDRDGDSVFTITRDLYYELDTKTVRTLANICSATELGDNLETVTDEEGITQYVRDNPFWELREDLNTLLENGIAAIGGCSICQFDCDWSGDYRLEIGDKIDLVTEDNKTVTSYFLCDIIDYAGYLTQLTEWVYSEPTSETASNPTNIGDKINQTFARVDKVNKEIQLMVSDVDETKAMVSKLDITTQGINSTVTKLETNVEATINGVVTNIEALTKEVGLKVDEDDVTILVTNKLQEGVDKVITTSKKYAFDDEGLKVSSSGNNLSTFITEDGMQVYRAGTEVLTANNEGVRAEDLHATTYLIIGNTSRLEDRMNRTACYWIGD